MYEIITLPNGVRIAHEKMSGVRSAAVGIWVGVGSRYEKRGEEGSAHFIEHMLFKGTANSTAAELAGRMDAIGGQVNAFTSRDSTCFYARVLDSHLDEASDILCEMFFDSLFSESDIVNERGVVLEEIDMYRDTPEDIVVREALEVAEDFNAILSCQKKEYTYRIYNSRIKNPFYVNRAYFYPKHLDEEVMDRAARAFEGTHDFRAVRSVGTETKTTVRTVHYCRVSRSGDLLELKVCADGFLYNMVRAITGTVLYAAEGKLTPEDIPEILASGDRSLAGPTVPPGGLYMTRLWYEDERLNE